MKKLRQGFSWWCVANRGIEPAQLFTGAAKIGYTAVDLVQPEFWPMLRDAGLKLGAIAGHETISEGLNQKRNASRIEAELEASIAEAVQWGNPILICFSGNRDGLDDGTGLENCAELLARIAPTAEKAGVTLAVELLNSKRDHRDYQCDSTAWGVRLCERVDSPAVQLLYDIYHMQIMEGDIIQTIRQHHTHFAHYHTAGNPGRGQPDGSQEINYPAIYQAIAELGEDKMICHEFIPAGDPLEALQKAFDDCEAAFG